MSSDLGRFLALIKNSASKTYINMRGISYLVQRELLLIVSFDHINKMIRKKYNFALPFFAMHSSFSAIDSLCANVGA